MLLVCMFFFRLRSHFQYSCWEITSVLTLSPHTHTHCVCVVAHSLYLLANPSGWIIAIVIFGRCVLLFLLLSLFLIAFTLAVTLNADGRWAPPSHAPLNSIANVMRSNLLRRNCFANNIPYPNNFGGRKNQLFTKQQRPRKKKVN